MAPPINEAPPGLFLYNLTLVSPGAVTAVCVGNFSPISKEQLILTCHGGSRLELGQVNKQTGKYQVITSTHAFGTIRALSPFRLTGGTRDYIMVGSDSGRIVVLEYDPENNSFKKIHQETFGKSGARRIVPGQYLAADPKGRAIMIGAVEKAKMYVRVPRQAHAHSVYILNRDANSNLTISSPLEAHKQHGIIHSMVGLDVGFENPLFAALEVDYSDADQDPTGEAFNTTEKMLTYYELDLGLNHVVRKWSEPTDSRANLLIPQHWDGPSGVLVCCENQIIYRHQGVPEHRIPIPRRETPLSDPERGIIITSGVVHRMRGDFFVLLQSEEGDLFKVTIDRNEEEVLAIKIKYFDTVPVATQLVILRSGFLYVASEYGNPQVYQFDKLGEEGDEISSADASNFGAGVDPTPSFFRARPLENLILVDEVDSLAPITDGRVVNVLGTDAPQIITACGRGPRSSMRMIRHGLEVEELVGSPLGFAPTGIWATKLKASDEYDAYIVLSAANATYVLSIGESIEQVQDTGLEETARTLGVQQLGEDSIVQVHTDGFVRLRGDGRREPWPEAPQRVSLACATTNRRQIVLATQEGELVYFAVDNDGELNEYMERKALGAGVACMSIAEVSEGHQRTPFLAVGCEDQTVRIISLDPDTCMDTISIQALTAPPTSICMLEMLDAAVDKVHTTLFVNIGLQNGVQLRTVLDPSSGQLTDTRTRFLGSRPVKLRRAVLKGLPSLVALSSRTWVNYSHDGLLQFDPLIFDTLDHACALSAEVCPEGLIGITGDVLRLFTLPKLGNKVKLDTVKLDLTPRRFVYHPNLAVSYVIETDHRVLPAAEAESRLAGQSDEEKTSYQLPPEQFGHPRAPGGIWSSSLRVVNSQLPAEGFTIQQLELDNNEAAFSIAVVPFAARDWQLHLCVGTGQDTTLAPRSCKAGWIRTYTIHDEGRRLELLHKTECDDIPSALLAFQGRLVAGVGRALRLYEMGKKRLLRKAENKTLPTGIVTLQTQGSRIIIGDIQESIHYAVFKAPEMRLIVFADDSQPRWITCSTMVDYMTVAGGDKFGNVFINRLGQKWSDEVDADSTGAGLLYEKPFLQGAPRKTEMLAHFNVGDVLTSIQKVPLVQGGRDVLLYTGFSGTIGALVPFVSSEDVDFFQTLEMHMRTEMPSVIGRDHMSYRGYTAPCKAVIDGDLCELFARLPMTKQAQIAQELDRTLAEVLKKIEIVRSLNCGW